MKKVLIILFFLLSLTASATNYYVKSGGNDLAAGISDGTAWATISKVNSRTFSNGDTIFFNKGDTWRIYTATSSGAGARLVTDSGTAAPGIVYTSYGTGDKPKLLGSVTKNETADWTNSAGNIWYTTDASFALSHGPGNIIFDNEDHIGVKIGHYLNAYTTLDAEFEWCWDNDDDIVYLYCTENPATHYTNIEIATYASIIFMGSGAIGGGTNYCTLDGLDIRYSGVLGIDAKYGNDYVTIRNCEVAYIGGSEFGPTARFGNGIQFYQACSNILIENNLIYQCYDAGFSTQRSTGTDIFTVEDITVRNNIIRNNQYNFEYFENSVNCTVDDYYFENNTLAGGGTCWGATQRPNTVNGCNIRVATSTGATTDFYIRNNIFSEATNQSIYVTNSAYISGWTIDYNVYNSTALGRIASTYYYTLATWQAATNIDESHGLSSDPLFVSATDFSLQSGSPAIDVGVNTGITTDYNYDERPYNTLYDIGAYEYSPDIPAVDAIVVTTTRPYWTSATTAMSGGNVTDDGGGTVTQRGVCWNTAGTPTVADNKTSDGAGTGVYSSTLGSLSKANTYYVRAYAVNEAGTSYGEELVFRDSQMLGKDGKALISKDGKQLIIQ